MTIARLPELIPEKDAAIKLGVSIDTMRRLRNAGKIDFRKTGIGRGRICYTYQDLNNYIESCKVELCPNKDPDDLAIFGLAKDRIARTGAKHGMKMDKHAASYLAQQTFRRPNTGLQNGMWKNATCATSSQITSE